MTQMQRKRKVRSWRMLRKANANPKAMGLAMKLSRRKVGGKIKTRREAPSEQRNRTLNHRQRRKVRNERSRVRAKERKWIA